MKDFSMSVLVTLLVMAVYSLIFVGIAYWLGWNIWRAAHYGAIGGVLILIKCCILGNILHEKDKYYSLVS